jgi:phenylacetate-CoA ligase
MNDTNYFTEADPARITREFPLGVRFDEMRHNCSADELHALRERRFLNVVERAWQVPFYVRRWRAAGLEPGAIQSLGQLGDIPVFTKSELMESVAEHPPFGDFHGMDDLPGATRRQVILHTTSGTTGDPQPLFFGAWDREVQNALLARVYRMHGVRDEDVVHSVYGFGMVNGGHFVREALTHFTRALVLTPGTGADTASVRQVQMMAHFGVTVLVGFADYLLRLAEVAQEQGLMPGRDLKVRLLSGHIPQARQAQLQAAWGGAEVRDWYGVGDTGVIAAQAPGEDGLLVFEDAHAVEIVDPENHVEVPAGQPGNQCVTVLFKNTVYPIVRFDTQDVSALLPPTFGAFRRTAGFLGRSDNMVKLRGINVYPTAIAGLLDTWPKATGEYLCRVQRNGAIDEMTVQVEWAGEAGEAETADVANTLREALGVRIHVELCAPGSTAMLTEIETRQKPRRLRDERT